MIQPQNNPLFQLLSKSKDNWMMFFTPHLRDAYTDPKEYELSVKTHYCHMCHNTRDLMLLPVNVQLTRYKCLTCYTFKLKMEAPDNKIFKPHELTKQIFQQVA